MNVSRLVKRAEDGRHGADCEMDIYSCGGQGFVSHQGLYCHEVGAVLVEMRAKSVTKM